MIENRLSESHHGRTSLQVGQSDGLGQWGHGSASGSSVFKGQLDVQVQCSGTQRRMPNECALWPEK